MDKPSALFAVLVSLSISSASAYEDPREKAAREAVNGISDEQRERVNSKRSVLNADEIVRQRGQHMGGGISVVQSPPNNYDQRNYSQQTYIGNQMNVTGGGATSDSSPRGRAAVSAAGDSRIEEQERRCTIESTSLANSYRGQKGPECRKLDFMLAGATGTAIPDEITVNNYGPHGGHVVDQYGVQYNHLGGNTVLNTRTGKVCQNNGGTISCP